MFTTLLNISLGIFILGSIYKVSTWFRLKIGLPADGFTVFQRVIAALKGILKVIFSKKLLTLICVFWVDVVFQRRIMKESVIRWLMHLFIYTGFMFLLLMHAMDAIFTERLFMDYYPTVNPFLFLRDFFALIVFIGIGIAIYRRCFVRNPRVKNHAMDVYAITILTVIMISGISLEGAKIASYNEFQSMVDEYADFDTGEERIDLESLWVDEYGIVSPNVKGPFDPGVLKRGMEVNEINCLECHSSTKWAFAGYSLAKTIRPFALSLDRFDITGILWTIHIVACFIGLAYLPFSKMFHIIVSPISLLTNAVMDRESDPANMATKQAMELDACTHCGVCTLHCAVGICFEEFLNIKILPSEKMKPIKALIGGKSLNEREMRIIQEGLYLCTNCNRCTEACPSGINLQDLWFNVREALLQEGYPELLTLTPLSFYRGLKGEGIQEGYYQRPLHMIQNAIDDEYNDGDVTEKIDIPTRFGEIIKKKLLDSHQGDTFSSCFRCQTCSMACPVVMNFENPVKALGMMPHQIIHAAIIGVPDMALGSKMLWSCLGCYECHEYCPQGVQVTDIIYELKSLAVEDLKKRI